jgi:hypothetical protein
MRLASLSKIGRVFRHFRILEKSIEGYFCGTFKPFIQNISASENFSRLKRTGLPSYSAHNMFPQQVRAGLYSIGLAG